MAVRGGEADACAAGAAAQLAHGRRRPPPLLTLETLYVSGVSRDIRQHRLRALLAEVTGVAVHALVDVDRCGAATEVTLVAAAVPAFVAAAGREHAATVLRVLPGVDPWSPALLGPARRRALGGGERAAEVSAGFCRQRLLDKLAQLPRRDALRLPVRQALEAHVRGRLAAHPRGRAGATAAASPAAARLPGAAARVTARQSGAVSRAPVLVGVAGGNPAGQSNADRRPFSPPAEWHFGGAMGTAATTMERIVVAAPAAADSIAAAAGASPADAAESLAAHTRASPAQNSVGVRVAAAADWATSASAAPPPSPTPVPPARGGTRALPSSAVAAAAVPPPTPASPPSRRTPAALVAPPASPLSPGGGRGALLLPLLAARPVAPVSPVPFRLPPATGTPGCCSRRRRALTAAAASTLGASAAGGLPAPPSPSRPRKAAAIADAVAAAAVALPSARRARNRGAADTGATASNDRTPVFSPRVPSRRPPCVPAGAHAGAPKRSPARAAGARTRPAHAAPSPRSMSPAASPASAKRRRLLGPPTTRSAAAAATPAGAAARAEVARLQPHSTPVTPGPYRPGSAARVSNKGRHE